MISRAKSTGVAKKHRTTYIGKRSEAGNINIPIKVLCIINQRIESYRDSIHCKWEGGDSIN